MEKLIHSVLVEGLADKQYSHELCKTWTEQISESIKAKLKGESNYPHPPSSQTTTNTLLVSPHPPELNLERYKYVVQVVIGEQRGEGAK